MKSPHRLRTFVGTVCALATLVVASPAAEAVTVHAEAPDAAGGDLPTFNCKLQSNFRPERDGIYFTGSASCDRAPAEIYIDSELYDDDGRWVAGPTANRATGVKSLSTPHGYCERNAPCGSGLYEVLSYFEIRAPGWNMLYTSTGYDQVTCNRPYQSSTYYCEVSAWRSFT